MLLNNPIYQVEHLLAGTSQGPWSIVGPSAADGVIRIFDACGRLVATVEAGAACWERMAALADARLLVEAPTLLVAMAEEVVGILDDDRTEDLEYELSHAENRADDAEDALKTLASSIAEKIASLSVDDHASAESMRAAAEAVAREAGAA